MQHPYLPLLALLLLTGCSQDIIKDSPNTHSGKYIAFNPLTGKSDTRAEVVNNDNLENFAVWAAESLAIATPTLVLDNELVYRDTQGDWTYEPPALWKGNTMDFYAYAPALSTNARYADGVITYTVPTETAKGQVSQEDFLVAKNLAAPSGSDVTLQFQHALSRAVFRAKSEVQQVNLVIKRVTLNNLYSTGTLNFATSDIPETGTFAYDAVDHDPATTLWIPQTSMVEDYDVAITQDVTTPDSDNTSILITNEMKQIHRNADALMVLPQTTAPASITNNVVATPETSFYIAVNWALASKPGDVKTTNFPVVFPDTGTQFAFEAGRQYTFDITMTAANGVATINLKPSVSDWQPYNNEEDEIPDNIPVPLVAAEIGKPWPIGSKGAAVEGVITGVKDGEVTEILYFIKEEMKMADLTENPTGIDDVASYILANNTLTQPDNGTWEAQAWSAEPDKTFITTYLTPLYSEATGRDAVPIDDEDYDPKDGDVLYYYAFWPDAASGPLNGKLADFNVLGIPILASTAVAYFTVGGEAPYDIDLFMQTIGPMVTKVASLGNTMVMAGDLIGANCVDAGLGTTISLDKDRNSMQKLYGAMIPLKVKASTSSGITYKVGDYYPNPKVASSQFVYQIDKDGGATSIMEFYELNMPTDKDAGVVFTGSGTWSDGSAYPTDATIGLDQAIENYVKAFEDKNPSLYVTTAGKAWEDYESKVLSTLGDITSYYELYQSISTITGNSDYAIFPIIDKKVPIDLTLLDGSKTWNELGSGITTGEDRYFGKVFGLLKNANYTGGKDTSGFIMRVSLTIDQTLQTYSWEIEPINTTSDWLIERDWDNYIPANALVYGLTITSL